ncbi:glycosyltransferase [Roseivirga sp.]|uniref:glycosyltransferase n=1 Tax=Roseivirga sp. TaxID=1964215 RepID=UPI003B8B3C15
MEGTGVDLEYYRSSSKESKSDVVKFLFIARLIKEKGIPELFEAAKRLKQKHSNFEVQLLGWVDPNPGGISSQEIESMHATGIINYMGTTDDIRPFMDNADVFVLPTYYNEGLPRTIQEAMAMSKPIITTDHPGCRETVDHDKNGFLIPTKDSLALEKAIEYFIQNPGHIAKMGAKSLMMAQEKFDVNKINERIFNFMNLNNV